MNINNELIRAYKKLTDKINKLFKGKYNEAKMIKLLDRETGMYNAFCEVFKNSSWKRSIPNTISITRDDYYRAILRRFPELTNKSVKRILKQEKKDAISGKETKHFNFYNGKSIDKVHGMQSDFEPFQGNPNPEITDWMKEINERLRREREIEDMDSNEPCDCFQGKCNQSECRACRYFDFSGVPKSWAKSDPNKWDDEEEEEDLKKRGVYQIRGNILTVDRTFR